MQKWTDEWKRTAPRGGFGPADRLPPSWKPKRYFQETKREVFGRVVQCRTGHAFIGEYYSKFVPTETVRCRCGTAYQTRAHLLRECELYEDHRGILRDFSPQIVLPDVLGTENGIAALAGFLEKSGAFTKTGRPRAEPSEPALDDAEDEEDDDATEWSDGYRADGSDEDVEDD